MAPFSLKKLFGGHSEKRGEPEVVEPEHCYTVPLSPTASTEICKTPDVVSNKYGCDFWIPMHIFILLFDFDPEKSSKRVKNIKVVNLKRGEGVFPFVCCEDVVAQVRVLLSQLKLLSFEALWVLMEILKIYTFRALEGDAKAAKLLGVEGSVYSAKRIEEIRKQKQQSQQQ